VHERPNAGTLIPKTRYLSPDFLRLELDRVFARTWHMAGPVSDLDRPGAYFTFEIGGESAIVVRTETGVRAMHNVCVHRGRTLREPGFGHATSFRCPFHHWEYELDGRLRRITDPGAFPAAASCLQLKPVAAEVFEGLVWVNFAAEPEPLVRFLGPLAQRLAAYHFEDYAIVEDNTLDVQCNWKVAADAFNEAYHLRAVHPELLEVLDETGVEVELVERHCSIRVPVGSPSPNWRGGAKLGDAQRHLLREAGMDADRFDGPPSAVREAIQRTLRASTAHRFEHLTDAQLTDNHYFFVFPSTSLSIYGLRAMALRYRPHPTDPGRMLLDHQEYVRVAAGRTRPPRPRHAELAPGGSLGTVNDQDVFNLIRVQRGMGSSGFQGLFIGAHEVCIRHLHDVLDRYIQND
jgi:phenylpropionate dioxygenase-like ring-hydroxylating dioxygenase large terminal subunit